MAKLTDQTALETPNKLDLIHVVDVSDTTDDAAGSSKKVELQHVPSAIAAEIKAAIADGITFTGPVAAPSFETTADDGERVALLPNNTVAYTVGAGETGLVTEDNVIKRFLNGGSKHALAAIIASGSQALGTTEIADGACASVITVSAPGVLTTDIVDIGYNSTPIGKTGYDPDAGAELSIRAYPTANNINILVCNRTGAAVTPAAMTVNWRVVR